MGTLLTTVTHLEPSKTSTLNFLLNAVNHFRKKLGSECSSGFFSGTFVGHYFLISQS